FRSSSASTAHCPCPVPDLHSFPPRRPSDLGPNGAGKTTCFYMIVGLVSADAGRILLDGQDITALPMHERARRGLGYLPQEASVRSEEHTSELQSRENLVCRLPLGKKNQLTV